MYLVMQLINKVNSSFNQNVLVFEAFEGTRYMQNVIKYFNNEKYYEFGKKWLYLVLKLYGSNISSIKIYFKHSIHVTLDGIYVYKTLGVSEVETSPHHLCIIKSGVLI